MDECDQLIVVRKANIYFDGNGMGRSAILDNNSKVTLGIMQP